MFLRKVFLSTIVAVILSLTAGFPVSIDDGKQRHPDIDRNVSEIIRSCGYPVEEHDVITKDGYILNIQRIPHGRNMSQQANKPVVFLQHGLLMDSTNWILNSAEDSLGYILADQGFDVWLGNIRGNAYSKRHVKKSRDQKDFWDFSWQEMAEYDLPAMVDHALAVSGQSKLFYVGHSQGTLIGFTGFSTNQKLAKKIEAFFALAPVYTVGHCSDIIKGAAYALYPLEHVFQNHANEEFVPGRLAKALGDAGFCGGSISEKLCYKAGETLFGFDSSNIKMSRVPVIVAHWGSGTSFKNIVHFGQMVTSGKCQKYDYGYWYNYMKYGQIHAPEYHVENMRTPAILFSGSHDRLASPLDVNHLRSRITNLHHFEEIQGWNHADFLYGTDAPQKVYNKMVKMMNDFLYKSKHPLSNTVKFQMNKKRNNN